MDWIALKNNILEYIKKYRYLVLVLVTGLFLMLMPQQEKTAAIPVLETAASTANLQESLAEILSMISGVGKVEVLLTQAEGEKTFFQTDDEISVDKTRREAVLVTNSSREETGLVRQIDPPKYLGAVVVCQGAEHASVRLAVVEAVMSVTGLTSDHITVLKMK